MAYIASTDVPRKGNVDRNVCDSVPSANISVTFPARGTWIEMRRRKPKILAWTDVPRKGNVDRNESISKIVIYVDGRSPQGERG